jgi:hypothetical protein
LGAARTLQRAFSERGVSGLVAQVKYGVKRRRNIREQRRAARQAELAAVPPLQPSFATAHEESLQRAVARLRFGVGPNGEAPEDPNPAVAVIVPSYGDRKFLTDAIRSLQAQTYENWHCYVVDDCSPSDLSDVESLDNRVTLLRHASNRGLAAARNTGILASTEPLIQFLDDDDLLAPESLERRVAALMPHWWTDHVAGVYGTVLQTPEETNLEDLLQWPSTGRQTSTVDWIDSGGENQFAVHQALTKRIAIETAGGFDPELRKGAEDWEFWDRVFRSGYTFLGSDVVVGCYRQRATSMIRADNDHHASIAKQLFARSQTPLRAAVGAPNGGVVQTADEARRRHMAARRAAMYHCVRVGQQGSLAGVGDDVLDLLQGYGWPPSRAEEIRISSRNALIRGLDLSREAFQQMSVAERERIEDLLDSALEQLRDATPTEPTEDTAESAELLPHSGTDVLLVPDDSAAAMAALPIVKRLTEAGLSVTGVSMSTYAGEQGAASVFAEYGVDSRDLADVLMGKSRAEKLLILGPQGAVADRLAEAAISWGARVAVSGAADRLADDRAGSGWQNDLEHVTEDNVLEWVKMGPDKPVGGFWRASSGLLCADELAREETAPDADGSEWFTSMKDAYAGQTCVIIGNGPSLNEIDFSLFKGVPTFGVNAIFLADDRLPDPLTFYVVEDTAVFRDNEEQVKEYQATHRLFPTLYKPNFSREQIGENTHFFRMNMGFYGRGTSSLCLPRFSTRADERLFCGQSVTHINLQLAYWFGFTRVVLVGMDFSYTVPEDSEVKGNHITSRGDDPNHFHPDYFGAGKVWKDPKLDRVLANYELSKAMYEADGREIINATVGGKLEAFRRMDLAEALGR